MLTRWDPDLVLVQHKPDRLIDEFQYLPTTGKVEYGQQTKLKFDADTYINQLVVEGHQLFYNYRHMKRMIKKLRSAGIFAKSRYPQETEQQYAARKDHMMSFGNIDLRERIDADSITTIGLWAVSHNKPVILSDIPDYIFRRNISRHESLIEMRDLLAEACKDLILDPNIEIFRPYFGAIHRYPDIMFHYNDRYTASLINIIIKRNPHLKSIAVMWGYGQTKSIPTYLQFSECSLFDNLRTQDSKTQKHFGKTDKLHHMIEKQVILDHLGIHRDENAMEFWEQKEQLYNSEFYDLASAQFNIDPLLKVIKYFVTHELMGSTNSPDYDYNYFKHMYMVLFGQNVNDIRMEAYQKARVQLQNEFKRRVRDNPDLIRKIEVHSA